MPRTRPLPSLGVALLVLSASMLAAAPLVLPESYSWIEHTTSESAAQGVEAAWVARVGFVTFGLAVLWIAAGARRRWGRAATALHAVFGACLVAVAVFSTRSWIPAADVDATEDRLHSVFATTMGFAFVAGVVAVAMHVRSRTGAWRRRDVAAAVATTLIPLSMTALGSVDGALQRVMFAVAYAWYGFESGPAELTSRRDDS